MTEINQCNVSRTSQFLYNQNLIIIKKKTWQKPVNVSRTIHLHHSSVSAWNEPCDPWRRMSRIWPSITIRVHASHLYDRVRTSHFERTWWKCGGSKVPGNQMCHPRVFMQKCQQTVWYQLLGQGLSDANRFGWNLIQVITFWKTRWHYRIRFKISDVQSINLWWIFWKLAGD